MTPDRLATIELSILKNRARFDLPELALELIEALKEAGCVAPVLVPETVSPAKGAGSAEVVAPSDAPVSAPIDVAPSLTDSDLAMLTEGAKPTPPASPAAKKKAGK